MLATFTRWWRLRSEVELEKRDQNNLSYYVMLAAAAIIATLAILADNSTVVIGAMLVAPLMVPIMALAVAIDHGNGYGIIKALNHISLSIVVVVSISLALAKILPLAEIPHQALLRAQPNILDFFLAAVAGSLGMYAYLHRDVPESLAGVAIAVALVPPLTVVGMGFGLGAYLLSLGATVLFFTNLVTITLFAVLMLWAHGILARQEKQRRIALASALVTIVIAVVLAVLLGGSFWQVYKENDRKVQVRKTLEKELKPLEADISEVEVRFSEGKVRVSAVLKVPEENLDTLDAEKLNSALVYALEQSTDLQIAILPLERAKRQVTETERLQMQADKARILEGVPESSDSANIEASGSSAASAAAKMAP